jgi:transcriptional regulator with XRE-family HTH domain
MGQRIAGLREAKKITQQQLADQLGEVRETVKHWENGTRHIKDESIIKLSQFFGVTTDYILCASESKTPADTDMTILIDRFGFSPIAARELTVLSIPANGEWAISRFEALNALLEQTTEFEAILRALYECIHFSQTVTPFEIAVKEGSFPDEMAQMTSNADNFIRTDRAMYRSATTYNPQHWMRIVAERFLKNSEKQKTAPGDGDAESGHGGQNETLAL